MKILFFAIGTEVVASSRTRVYQLIPHLKKNGIECKVISYLSERRCRDDILANRPEIFTRIGDKISCWLRIFKVLALAGGYDVIVIQRVLLPLFVQRLLRGCSRKIVFDFDDALQSLKGKFFVRFIGLLKISDLIVLENDFNKEFVLRHNSSVLIMTGPIDIQRYRPAADSRGVGPVTIGWVGTFTTAKYLDIVREPLKRLKDKFGEGLEIKIISSRELKWTDIPYRFVKWQLDSEIRELSIFDIGIMPLADDSWCLGKGGYKLLQYMAIGIPCVASPVGINTQLIEEGITGFFPVTADEWFDKLSCLINNIDLRRRMGKEGRKKVEEFYSYEVAAPKFISVIS